MGLNCKKIILLIFVTTLTNGQNIRLPDQTGPGIQQQQQPLAEGNRQGKHLLDFVGLGTGSNVDPYVAKTNNNCLSGDLAECFKSQALGSFNDFFAREEYVFTQNARIIRMPDYQLRSLEQEPYEFSSESRSADTEWDQLVKFALRKAERFLKSTAFEIQVSDEATEGGRYSPRFIDEITDEIDVLEDKKAPLFKRNRLKKLFIPFLIILKLFKLKLLLFLPLILGLASFKKLLGFAALVIPGVIGYFKLCRPQQQNFGNYNANAIHPQYSAQGMGSANYHQHYVEPSGNYFKQGHSSSYADPYSQYYRDANVQSAHNENLAGAGGGGVRFGDDSGQSLAYQGYSEYRNKKVE